MSTVRKHGWRGCSRVAGGECDHFAVDLDTLSWGFIFCKDRRKGCWGGALTVAVTASVLLPLGGQQLGAMAEMAAWTPSSASLRSSWTGAPTRGSPPSPPKCGREKKASQREILPGGPASSRGGNPQRHRPRAGGLARVPAPNVLGAR